MGSITEIKFSDNDSKDIDKKINVLKQQIRSQQDSIVRLKESLLRAKNANKYAANNQDYYQNESKTSEEYTMGKHIGDAGLDQIVDDVIKKYDVLDFKTS